VNSKSQDISWMGSSSSEGEDRSTTGAFPEGPLAQTPASEDSERIPPTGILEVTEGSWCRWP
jgi:hypothetical protein